MNCQKATRLMSDAQERQLSLKERAGLEIHVLMCSGCRNFGKHMGTLRDIAQTYAKGENTQENPNSIERPDGDLPK